MKIKNRIPHYLWIMKVRNLMIKKEEQGKTDGLLFWQQFIFVNLMLTIITIGLGVLIPGILQFINEDMFFAAMGLIGFYLFFLFLSFARSIHFKMRQKMVAWGFYALSIMIINLYRTLGSR